jgi:F-type H+-transporting ATPase subunit b
MLQRTIPVLGLLALVLALGSPSRLALAQDKAKDHDAPVQKAEGETAKGEHGGSPNVMEVQSPLAIWSLFVFLGLLFVLGKYAWTPMMKALHERESHLEQVLLDSEKARNDAEALAAQHRKELSQAADQVRALIEEAKTAATSILQKAQQQAQTEAEASRHRAEQEIANAKDQALMEIWSSTANLAVSVAGKVLGKELGEADHRRLVEVAMQELPANGNGREGARS